MNIVNLISMQHIDNTIFRGLLNIFSLDLYEITRIARLSERKDVVRDGVRKDFRCLR